MKWTNADGTYTAVTERGSVYQVAKDSWQPSRPWRISVQPAGTSKMLKTSSAFRSLKAAQQLCESAAGMNGQPVARGEK